MEKEKNSSGQSARAWVLWHSYLSGDVSQLDAMTKAVRQIFKRLPSELRCKVCKAPFQGLGGMAVKLIGFGAGRSSLNPTLCSRCEILVKRYQVGAEVPLTLLFADVRGSTALAEEMGASAFHHLMNRFYTASTQVLIQSNALIEKMVGDEVAGMYVPGIAGPDHARVAVDAARYLMKATGQDGRGEPWIRVGVGIHTGVGYVGAVGSAQAVSDITVLGDVANTTARLASMAGAGEILVSDDAIRAAGLRPDQGESRVLQLKGRSQLVQVQVIRVLEKDAM